MKDRLDQLIKEAMKSQNSTRLKVLRAIKTEFMKVETAKDAKELDEIAVLRKMKKDREESANTYTLANRLDLALEEANEATILSEFIPSGPSEEDIRASLTIVLAENGLELVQKNMGGIMKGMKVKLPTADMKLVGEIVKSML